MKLKRLLTGGEVGRDVLAIKRGLGRFAQKEGAGDTFFKRPKGGYSDKYNPTTKNAVAAFQRWKRLKVDGELGQKTLDALWPFMDLYSRYMYRRFKPPKPKAPTSKPVEPKQGWGSLTRSLWGLYSEARNMGLSDLGTYNPASRLPSGRPSDHAVYPARAFDAGFSPATGYAHPTARRFFDIARNDSNVEYVILGNRIWSRARGLHSYTGGGHESHVHVSGRH